MSDFIDISVAIRSDAVVYPGDPALEVERIADIGTSGDYRLTRLGWTTHFLTHLDAPSHFIPDGQTIDQIPLHRFTGDTLVVETTGRTIQPSIIPEDFWGMNILFKTSRDFNYSRRTFWTEHPYIGIEAARLLVERRVNLVGIDYLDIERCGDVSYPAHRELLGHGVLILEGIDLSKVEPGRYILLALPLKIEGADGSPVRAVLVPIASASER